MSLLYEAISGIIQGGILDGADGGVSVDEVADLCISKLRGMIVLEGDPNLKYVALLAFNKIVGSHPIYVAMQQDVILACLDDPDISIRLQALELASGMVSSDNLHSIVDRLMKQLANAPTNQETNGNSNEGDNTDLEQKLVPDKRGTDLPPLPDEYRKEVISRILDMCSINTYSNITDFEWYVETLIKLIQHLPARAEDVRDITQNEATDLADRIGWQLLDIAVRVKELRPETVKAAEKLVLISTRTSLFASHGSGQNEILKAAAWICGEYPDHITDPYDMINSLVHESSQNLGPKALIIFIQAVPKIFSRIAITASRSWNLSRKSTMSLILARIISFLDTLSTHPNLEVQERSVEFLELLKLGSEALSGQPDDSLEAPLLLTHAIPNLFDGQEINPVAASAQKKVPLPKGLDLDAPINPNLQAILQESQIADATDESDEDAAFYAFYNEREIAAAPMILQPGIQPSTRYVEPDDEPLSYQAAESPSTLARRKAERMARTKDDPFYIPGGTHTPTNEMHNIIAGSNGPDDFDLDSIPIIDLKIDQTQLGDHMQQSALSKKKPKKKFVVAADETLEPSTGEAPSLSQSRSASRSPMPGAPVPRSSRNLLSVDSSNLGSFSLTESTGLDATSQLEIERRIAEEAEMAAALKEVERKRLELAREEERARTQYAEGAEDEGVVVKRKKKKVKKKSEADSADVVEGEAGDDGEVVKKKKKKKRKEKAVDEGRAELEGRSTVT